MYQKAVLYIVQRAKMLIRFMKSCVRREYPPPDIMQDCPAGSADRIRRISFTIHVR